MSSRDGFLHADVDVGLMTDPKVLRLVRSTPRDRIATAILLYASLLLASWREGKRLTLEDGLPAWWTDDPEIYRATLRSAGLLDRTGRIPARSWETWYGFARDRRERARESGREGNRVRWQSRRDRVAIGSRSQSDSQTDSQSNARPRARRASKEPARANGDPRPLGDILQEIDPTFVPPTKERHGKP